MQLSEPIHRLKRRARLLSRSKRIPLHQALDLIAAKEGFASWSLLASKVSALTPAKRLLARLTPGDLVLIGACPGQGKTKLSFELAVEAMKLNRRCVFFTLEYTGKEVVDRLRAAGGGDGFNGHFAFDVSDKISADYIIGQLNSAPSGTLAVIDYLQLLDQRRENPNLNEQILQLRQFARDRGLIFVFLSQISRSYDPGTKPCPDMGDVRLPNPIDLGAFTTTCFLNDGKVRFESTRPGA